MSATTITSADGTELAARCSGEGSPLVLVHGANGVLAIVDAAGAGAHLVGHSGGALYSLFAATQATSLRSLVLYEPPPAP